MVHVLLIWLASFFSGPGQEPLFNCREYNLTLDERGLLKSDKICYTSPLTISRKKHVLMVETDSLLVRFAILRSYVITTTEFGNQDQRGRYTGKLSFAVVIGRPDQLYAIREEHKQSGYYFSIHPINQNEAMPKPVSGRVLEVSNREICDL